MTRGDGRDLSLVFLIDALGYEQVGRGGFLDDRMPAERPRVRSVFGFSSAAIPSLLTGKPPREHGHWSMYRRNMGDSVFAPYATWLRIAGRLPRGQWRTRRWLGDRLRRNGLTGYFDLYEVPLRHLPLFDLCQRRNIYRPGAFSGARSLFDRLESARIAWRVWDWSCPTERAFAEMTQCAAGGSEQFLLLYTPELDATMHTHGPGSAAAKVWLKQCEEKIGRVIDAARSARRNPRVRIFGDHGMASVRGYADVAGVLARLALQMPRDYVVFLDSSMARFWYRNENAGSRIRSSLGELAGGRFVPDSEMAAMGVDMAERAYGESVWLCDPGIVILPSFMGHTPLAGMHGYHPDDPDTDTTLLADPAPASPVSSILEITPLLLADLGLDAGGQ
jgi:predicted AlkP superfamily pyrophosphatase or phosphodiesterase